MKIADISIRDGIKKAATSGLRYQAGPFAVCIYTRNTSLVELILRFYNQSTLLEDDAVCQFHIDVLRSGGLRRFIRPKAIFSIDAIRPFDPYPYDQAFPMLEWGLNWCIGSTAHQYLILHSAVVERNGKALVLPAQPGSGKSTLCAGLISRGWRLLSDEFGIIDQKTGMMVPLPRVIPLKNESIELVQHYAPEAVFGPIFRKTRKGDVCHMAPPPSSLQRQLEQAKPAWVIFPKYKHGQKTELKVEDKGVAFTRMSNNAFNYPMTMGRGFQTLTGLAKQAQCFSLQSGDLDEAVTLLTQLADECET